MLLLSLYSLCLFQASELIFTYGSLRHLVGLLGRGISPAPRPLSTQDNTNTEKRRHTSMPRAEFEPAISTFERPKTVLALDRAAIETGVYQIYICNFTYVAYISNVLLTKENTHMYQSSIRRLVYTHEFMLTRVANRLLWRCNHQIVTRTSGLY
jgi:hypothetical protein